LEKYNQPAWSRVFVVAISVEFLNRPFGVKGSLKREVFQVLIDREWAVWRKYY
jgi:hypothetical protein